MGNELSATKIIEKKNGFFFLIMPSVTKSTTFADAIPKERLYYNLASETGGNVYLTEKPDHPSKLLQFLIDEITIGR